MSVFGAIQQWAQSSDVEPDVKVNENFEAAGQVFTFGHRATADTGLVVGFGGGPYNSLTIADGTVTCTNNTTNYIVAVRSTGVVSVSTATTDWNNTSTYGRIARAVFASSVLTFYDERFSEGGVYDHGASAGSVDSVNGQSGVVTLDADDIELPDPESVFGSPQTVGAGMRELEARVSAIVLSSGVSSVNGETGAVVLNADEIELPDPESVFGSPQTVGAGMRELQDLKALKAQTFEWSGMIEEPEEKSYTIVRKTPWAGAITETTTKATTGEGTATFKIDGSTIGGSANTVTSAEQDQAHSTSNTFSAGATITMLISAIGSPQLVDMDFTIKYTMNLS